MYKIVRELPAYDGSKELVEIEVAGKIFIAHRDSGELHLSYAAEEELRKQSKLPLQDKILPQEMRDFHL